MATITIEISDDVAAKLEAHAIAANVDLPTLMADIATRTATAPEVEIWDPRLSAEDIAEIRIGIAQAEAGNMIPHEQVMEEIFGRADA
jgi:predicted transcriptional regulator